MQCKLVRDSNDLDGIRLQVREVDFRFKGLSRLRQVEPNEERSSVEVDCFSFPMLHSLEVNRFGSPNARKDGLRGVGLALSAWPGY